MGNMLDFYENFWNPSLYCLNTIERNGIRFDCEVAKKAAVVSWLDVTPAEAELDKWAGGRVTSWASPKSVAEYLYGFKNYPIPPVKGTLKAVQSNREKKPVTSEAALLWLATNAATNDHDAVNLAKIVSNRKAKKYGTYLRNLPGYCDSEGRIHTALAPGTDTGRLSSWNPALQQIPKSDPYGIRRAFIPSRGNVFVVADYSQLEMYMLADLLKEQFDDDRLVKDLASGDVHSATARRIWPHLANIPNLKAHPEGSKRRDNSKTINYAVGYGKTASGLGLQICDVNGVPIGTKAAQAMLDMYFGIYPGIQQYQRWIQAYARKHGGVHTLLGRFRPLPEAQSSDKWEARAAGRKALNTPMQGGAADIVTAAMLRLNTDPLEELISRGWYNAELASLGAFMVLQVHDELIFEVPDANANRALELIKYGMEHPVKRKMHVEFKVDAQIAPNWAEGK